MCREVDTIALCQGQTAEVRALLKTSEVIL